MLDYATAKNKIMLLYDLAPSVANFYDPTTKEFIEAGELPLALDGIADGYLYHNVPMPAELFVIFVELADWMKLDRDPEYQAVAELRKKQAG